MKDFNEKELRGQYEGLGTFYRIIDLRMHCQDFRAGAFG